jgi:outer membrane protein
MPSLMQTTFPKLQRAALCALLLFCGSVGIAHALPNPTQIAAYEAATDDERVRLLMFLAANKQQDDAGYLLQQYPLSGPHAVNRTFFIQGLILKANGDLTGAAERFRGALADDPSLTLVRAELAKTLVMLEEDDSAKHHLKLLEAEAPNDQAASGIRSFIDKVDSRKPYKIGGYVSLAPSTNINNGSKHSTIYTPIIGPGGMIIFVPGDIGDASKEQSGLGFAGGLNGAYSKRLGNDFSFVAAGGVDVRIYDQSDFNSYGLSQSLEFRRNFDEGYLGFGAVASQSLDNKEIGLSYLSYGPRASMSIQANPQDHISATATYEWRNYTDSVTDGDALLLSASLTHAFSSNFVATVFLGLDLIGSDNDLQDYSTKSAGLSLYKELPAGVTAKVTGRYGRTEFENYNPMLLVTREDTRLSGTVELTKRDLNVFGFAPSFEYSYSRNYSNTVLFDFDSHAVDFRLTKDF